MRTQKKKLLSMYTALTLTVPITVGAVAPLTYASDILDTNDVADTNEVPSETGAVDTSETEQEVEVTPSLDAATSEETTQVQEESADTSVSEENAQVQEHEENVDTSVSKDNAQLQEDEATLPTSDDEAITEETPILETNEIQPLALDVFDVSGIFEVVYNEGDSTLQQTLTDICTSYQIIPEIIVNLKLSGTATLSTADQQYLGSLTRLEYVDIEDMAMQDNALGSNCLMQPNLKTVKLPKTLKTIYDGNLKKQITVENFPQALYYIPEGQFNGSTINADVHIQNLNTSLDLVNTYFRNCTINGDVYIEADTYVPTVFTTINGDMIIKSGYVETIGTKPIIFSKESDRDLVTNVNNVYIEDTRFLDGGAPYFLNHFNISGSVVLPQDAKLIPAYFCNSSNIGSLVVPDSVQKINVKAFDRGTTINTLKLNSTLEWIGVEGVQCTVGNPDTVFDTPHLPNSVTYVGQGAFAGSNIQFTVDTKTTNTNLLTCALNSFDNNVITGSVIEEEGLPLKVIKTGFSFDKVHFVLKNQNVIMEVSYDNQATSLQQAISTSLALDTYITADIVGVRIHSEKPLTEDDYATLRKYNYIVVDLSDTVETALPVGAFKDADELVTIILPQTLTTIGDNAFENCISLIETELGTGSLVLPSATDVIGKSAFKNTQSLTTVVLPDQLQVLEDETFFGSRISTITLPTSLTKIGKKCFYNANLTSIDMSSTNVQLIDDEAFAHNTQLAGELVIPVTLKTIGSYAFYNCEQLGGKIATTGITLGELAFLNSNVTVATSEVSQHLTVTYEVDHATLDEAITAQVGNTDWKQIKGLSIAIITADGQEISKGDYACLSQFVAIDLTQATLEGDLIPTSAFANNLNLTQIQFPSSLRYIGNRAFSGCRNLVMDLAFEQDDLDIGSRAFYGCASIPTLSFAGTGILIGDESFLGCTQLTGTVAKPQISSIGINAFSNTHFTITTDVTSNVLNINYDATIGSLQVMYKLALAENNYPSGVTTLKITCDANEYLTATDYRELFTLLRDNPQYKVLDLGDASVGGLNKMSPFNGPSNTVTIKDTFELDTIILPSNSTELGMYAFNPTYIGYTVNIKEIMLPETIVKIGSNILGDNHITTINLPDTVIEISENAFIGNMIATINVGSELFVKSNAFGTNIVIPRDGVLTLNTVTDVTLANQFNGDITVISLVNNTVTIGASQNIGEALASSKPCTVLGKFTYLDQSANNAANLKLTGLNCTSFKIDKVLTTVYDVICAEKSKLVVGVMNEGDYLKADYLKNVSLTVEQGVSKIGTLKRLLECDLTLPNSITEIGDPSDAKITYYNRAVSGDIGKVVDWSHLTNLKKVRSYGLGLYTNQLIMPSETEGYSLGYAGIDILKQYPNFTSSPNEKSNANAFVDLGNVTYLADGALNMVYYKFKEVPSNLTYIGNEAFNSAKFVNTDVTGKFRNVTYIGSRAFNYTNISGKVDIGAQTQVLSSAFYTTNIEEVVFGAKTPYSDTNTNFQGYSTANIFASCKALKKVTIKGTALSVPANAFEQCYALESVVVEEGVKALSEYAFRCENSLTPLNISLPSTLEYWGYYSITHHNAHITLNGDIYLNHPSVTQSTAIKAKTITGGNIHLENNKNNYAQAGIIYNYNSNNIGKFSDVTVYLTDKQLAYNDSAQQYYMKPYVVISTSNPTNPLTYPVALTDGITMAEALEEAIPNLDGVDLSSLQIVVTADRPITQTDLNAIFSSNISKFDLSSCELENNTITSGMFNGAASTLQIQFPQGIEKIEDEALYGRRLVNSTLDISKITYFGQSSLNNAQLNLVGIAKPTFIGEYAFSDFKPDNLECGIDVSQLKDSEGIVNIPTAAFSSTALGVIWGDTTEVSLGSSCFRMYKSNLDLSSIVIVSAAGSNNLYDTKIVSEVYADMPNIPYGFLQQSTLLAFHNAFENANIGDYAFTNTAKLTQITGTYGNLGEYAFCNSGLTAINGVTGNIGYRAFYGAASLNKVDLTGIGQIIGREAFIKSSLAEINLNTVDKIESQAFFECKNLKDISSLGQGNITSIGNNAFKGSGITGTVALDPAVCKFDLTAFEDTDIQIIATDVPSTTTLSLTYDQNGVLAYASEADAQLYTQKTYTGIRIIIKGTTTYVNPYDFLNTLDRDIDLTFETTLPNTSFTVFNSTGHIKNVHIISGESARLDLTSNTDLGVTSNGNISTLKVMGSCNATPIVTVLKDELVSLTLGENVSIEMYENLPKLKDLSYHNGTKGNFDILEAGLQIKNTVVMDSSFYPNKTKEEFAKLTSKFKLNFKQEPNWNTSYLCFADLDFTALTSPTTLTVISDKLFIGSTITGTEKVLNDKTTRIGNYSFYFVDFTEQEVTIPVQLFTTTVTQSTVSGRDANASTPFIGAKFNKMVITTPNDLYMQTASLFAGVNVNQVDFNVGKNLSFGSHLFSAPYYSSGTRPDYELLKTDFNIVTGGNFAIWGTPSDTYSRQQRGTTENTFINPNKLSITAQGTIDIPSRVVKTLNILELKSKSNSTINIKSEAFWGTKLKVFTLPENAKIGSGAFQKCSLSGDLYVPKTTTIAPNAFANCKFNGEFILDGKLDWSSGTIFNFTGSTFTNTELTLTPNLTSAYVNMEAFNNVETLTILGVKSLQLDSWAYKDYYSDTISKSSLSQYLQYMKEGSYPKLKSFTTDALTIEKGYSYRYLSLAPNLTDINLATGAQLQQNLNYSSLDLSEHSPIYSHLGVSVKGGGFPMPMAKNNTLVFKYGLGEITTDSLFTQYGRTLTEVYTPYTNDNLNSTKYLSYRIYDRKGNEVSVPLKYLQEGVYTIDLYWLGKKTDITTLIIEPSNLCTVKIETQGNGKLLGTTQRLITEGGLLSVEFTTAKNTIPSSYELNGIETKLNPEDKQITVPIVKDSDIKINFVDGSIQPVTVNTLYGYSYLDHSVVINKPQLMQLTTKIGQNQTTYSGKDFIETTSKIVVNDKPIVDLSQVNLTDTVIIASEFLALNDAFRGNTVDTVSVAKFEEPQLNAINLFSTPETIVLQSYEFKNIHTLDMTSRIPNEVTVDNINLLDVLSDKCIEYTATIDKVVDDLGNSVSPMKAGTTYTAVIRKTTRFAPLTSDEQAQLGTMKILSEPMALTDYTDVITYELVPIQLEGTVPTQKTHTITITSEGNGTATLDGRTPESENTYLANDGESITVIPAPDKYYTVDEVICNGNVVSTTEEVVPIDNVTEDLTIHVKFKQKTAIVHVSNSTGGTVTPSGETVVPQGDTLTIKATPEPGYKLDTIIINGVPTPTVSEEFTTTPIENNTTIEVGFTKVNHTVEIASSNGGTVTPIGTQTVTYGDQLTIISNAQPGYLLDKIIVNGTSISNPTTNYITEPITSDTSIRVEFAKTSNEVTIETSEGGTVNPVGTQTIEYGKTITITSTPNEGYELVKIIVNGKEVDNPTKVYTTQPITENTTVEVVFSKNTTLVTITTTEGGTVSPIGEKQVIYGETVTLTATPNEGYTLTEIKVNNETVANPSANYTTEPITKPTQIHYVFSKVPTPEKPTTPTTPSNTGTITIPKKERIKVTFYIGKKNWYINDIAQDYTMDVVPEIKDQRSFVPIRFLSYALKVNPMYVRWDSKSRSANIKDGDNVMTLYVGQELAYLNNQPHLMDTAAYLKRGRTMLPISQILEVYKHRNPEVKWDSDNQKVDIWLDIIADLNPGNPDYDWYIDYTQKLNH